MPEYFENILKHVTNIYSQYYIINVFIINYSLEHF